MILVAHIFIALTSLVYTTYLLFFPSKKGLFAAGALMVATLVSGVALVVLQPATMAHVCTTGLVYLAVVSVGLGLANRKLVTA